MLIEIRKLGVFDEDTKDFTLIVDRLGFCGLPTELNVDRRLRVNPDHWDVDGLSKVYSEAPFEVRLLYWQRMDL